jgi:predicted anti-sigma-YlaC factor YlaD
MDCTDIKVILSGLVDDEIDRGTRHDSERHLATCRECRALVNEAESLNAMIATEASALAGAGARALPAGFEAAVLGRTVYADGLAFNGRRWTTWLGWMAAAAVLGVSSVIAIINRDGSTDQVASSPFNSPVLPVAAYRTGSTMRSQVFDGDLTTTLASHVSSPIVSAVHAPADAGRPSLSADEVDHVLSQASDLMGLLQNADSTSFTDIEFIRRISASDNVLRQLPQVRQRLSDEDHEPVLAAEFILMRIDRGGLDMSDVQQMQDIVSKMDLTRRIRELTSRAAGQFSA